MAIKHDSIVPYLELGKLIFTAFAFVEEMEKDAVDLTITKKVHSKFVDVYKKRWYRTDLVDTLQKGSATSTFGLEGKLPDKELKNLDENKKDIIDYIKNLEKYYRMED